MLHFFFYLILIFNSSIFFFMNHPLSMGLILMIQTILMSLISGIFSKTFWFSYTLFLIFMGGMLVLFMYMTSLASNEIFKFNLKFKIFLLIFFIMMNYMIYFLIFDLKLSFSYNKIFNMENSNLIYSNFFTNKNNLMLNKMYNFPTNLITILLVNYLFLTLIMSVKITKIFQGPLRPKLLN